MTGDPFAVVKECKGAALSILVLLATNQQLDGGAVTQDWLERHSGYTDKPVSQALAYLEETGRIRQNSTGWVLAGVTGQAGERGSGQWRVKPGQPPEPVSASAGAGASVEADFEACSVRSPTPTVVGEGVQQSHVRQTPQVRQKPHGRKRRSFRHNSPGRQKTPVKPRRSNHISAEVGVFVGAASDVSAPYASPLRTRRAEAPESETDTAHPGPAAEHASRVGEGDPSRKISDSPTTTTAIDPDINPVKAVVEEGGVGKIPTRIDLGHVEANLAIFKKWGVGRNQKTILLSARPEVTPELIEDIARRLVDERRFTTGLLITAVQCGDGPLPDLPKRYGSRSQDRDPSRYAEWEE